MESLQKNKKRKNIACVVALISLSLMVISTSVVLHAADDSSGKPEKIENQTSADEKTTAGKEECCKPGDTTPPIDLVKKIPPGGLHSPYPDYAKLAKDEELVKQFRLPGCNECHGGTGGGGFCPALSQGVWFWGNTDDVLFRLISLGSADLEKQGFTRIQWGTVHAGMPMMGHTIKTADQLWKIIAFIRSINPPGTNPPEKLVAPRMHPIGEEGAASH
jgi:mono/diheme cytochrome c family protein